MCAVTHRSPQGDKRLKSGSVVLFLALTAPAFAQYSGPAILSRGEAPAAMSAPQIDFRPYIEVGASYDDGLVGVAVNDQGQVVGRTSEGATLTWGISGTHSWRHTKVGLEYHGSLNRYLSGGSSGYGYLDQSLLLGVSQQITRHISLNLRQTAGMVNQNFGQIGLRQTVPFDPTTSFVPVTDYFDNRTIYMTSQADLVVQKTARLSFDMGGDVFLIKRHSNALYGSEGTVARGMCNTASTAGPPWARSTCSCISLTPGCPAAPMGTPPWPHTQSGSAATWNSPGMAG